MYRDYLKKIIIKTITMQAKFVLNKFKPKIIAVTGNVGKTSTKDAIFLALKNYGDVRCSEKSFNGDTGVPLSILGLPNGWNNPIVWLSNIMHGFQIMFFDKQYPKYLVLEIGADHPNDILSIAKWLKPDISVFTYFPKVPVHIEFFSDLEEVIEEKKSLAKYTKKDGILILNHDDERVMELYNLEERLTFTFGTTKDSNLFIKKTVFDFDKNSPHGSTVDLSLDGKDYVLSLLNIASPGHVISANIALLVVHALGFDITNAIETLKDYRTPKGRFSIIDGINNTTIIDDTYNSSPYAVSHALSALNNIKTDGMKIGILGDMMELGLHTQTEHEKIGDEVVGVLDVLICVGNRSEYTYKQAIKKGFNKKNIFHVFSTDEVIPIVEKYLKPNNIFLCKASQSIRLEKVVKFLMADPDQASELLVRQEDEWKVR